MADTLADIAALIAIVLAATIFVVYMLVSRAERSNDPKYIREVYYRAGRPDSATPLATPAQLELYAAAGGLVVHAGRAAGSRAVYGNGPAGGCWLYGPKPAPGTPGVDPFGATHWFQTA